jgi:WD40 repeat protein
MKPLGLNEQASLVSALPDGKTVLLTIVPTRGNPTYAQIVRGIGARVDAVNLDSGESKTVLRGGAAARYAPTGHLVYAAAGQLHAVAFDPEGVEVMGEPVTLSDDPGAVDFDFSSDGTLMYTTGTSIPDRTLVWVDRNGREEPIPAPPRSYAYPQLSPDESRALLVVAESASQADRDIWTWDFGRRLLDRFITDPSDNVTAVWSLDGSQVLFASARTGTINVFRQAADGSGSAEHLMQSDQVQMPVRSAPDGRVLLSADVPKQARNILALTLDGTRQLTPVIAGPATDLTADVSPDGNWIVYDSNESGRMEVWVRPYPNTSGGRWRISTEGGRQPLWAPGGGELYFRSFDGAVMAVTVKLSPAFAFGTPVTIVEGAGYAGGGAAGSAVTYDVAKDGRFLMIKLDNPPPSSLVLVQNWFNDLERLVPRR